MTIRFNPYHEWLGIPLEEQPPNHYRLLGVPLFEENLGVISNAADRHVMFVRTYQNGKHADESQRVLNELSAARVCLLNAESKAEYDARLRAKSTPPPAAPRPSAAPPPPPVDPPATMPPSGYGAPIGHAPPQIAPAAPPVFAPTNAEPPNFAPSNFAPRPYGGVPSIVPQRNESDPNAWLLPVMAGSGVFGVFVVLYLVFAPIFSTPDNPPPIVTTSPVTPPKPPIPKPKKPETNPGTGVGTKPDPTKPMGTEVVKSEDVSLKPMQENSIGMKLVLIPAGEYVRGRQEAADPDAVDLPDEDEMFEVKATPAHRVKISRPFYMGQTEVTHGQWKAVTKLPLDEEFYGEVRDDSPMTFVSWNDATNYCQLLSAKEGKTYRLPSEAEWEYACRAGSKDAFSFGANRSQLDRYAWYQQLNDETPATMNPQRVAQKRPNAFKLHDMHGNVAEWCFDWAHSATYARYVTTTAVDPAGPVKGTERIVRGGHTTTSWQALRSWVRGKAPPESRSLGNGFRVVQVASAKDAIAASPIVPVGPVGGEVDPVSPPEKNPTLPGTASKKAPDLKQAFHGRRSNMRQVLLASQGGNKSTEDAVIAALDWLQRKQLPDGSWSATGAGMGKTKFSDGAQFENHTSATAMALMAFLAHGDTAESGTNRRNVATGWRYLLTRQQPDGSFLSDLHDDALYTHAQATIVACELYGMTKDDTHRRAAQRALAYCWKTQDPELGGWKHKARDSDTSVTTWFVMAIHAARIAGLDVPQERLDLVSTYLDGVAIDGGRQYRETSDTEATVATTAAGLLCRQLLGWKQSDPRLVAGCEVLLNNPPTFAKPDIYYWNYATQVLHNMEGEQWNRWNSEMRQIVPPRQITTGDERGSWPVGSDRWARSAGRLYQTCMCIYILEVYYRHMPLYSTPDLTAESP